MDHLKNAMAALGSKTATTNIETTLALKEIKGLLTSTLNVFAENVERDGEGNPVDEFDQHALGSMRGALEEIKMDWKDLVLQGWKRAVSQEGFEDLRGEDPQTVMSAFMEEQGEAYAENPDWWLQRILGRNATMEQILDAWAATNPRTLKKFINDYMKEMVTYYE